MTVSELFKKFRCCKPAPILPTTQIQTTSYTYQLAFVQWALEYVLSITEGYEERTSELETRATSVERAITQLQEGIDPILVDIEDLDDRVTVIEGLGNSLAETVNHLDTRVEALEQSGGSIKIYREAPDTELVNHYRFTIPVGFKPIALDLVFKSTGNVYTVYHMANIREVDNTQSVTFVDSNNVSIVCYLSYANDKIIIEDDFSSSIGPMISGTITAVKTNV